MVLQSSININKLNYTKKNKNFYGFDNILVNIFLISDIFEIINKLIKSLIKSDRRKINNVGKSKDNKIKIIKDKYSHNTIIRNYLLINLIKFIISNLFYKKTCNISFDLFYFQYSKITIKIKGIGDNYIFGYESTLKFNNRNLPKEIYINGNKQNTIEYKYYFNQTDNIFELIWNDSINDCSNMFAKCYKIFEINLSNFDTSKVTNMKYMFYNCSSLTSLDLSNLNTSQVTNAISIFSRCSSLISLDLSNFDTSQITSFYNMFSECTALTSVNLSNFNTSVAESMLFMFCKCSSLTSLDLSNFDTSQVRDMNNMFSYCSSLTSLNLSNFDTSQVLNMKSMFYKCNNLEYINLNNFDDRQLNQLNQSQMFTNIPINVVIYTKKNISELKIYNQIKYKCYTIYANDDWKSHQKKIINNTSNCIERCENSSQYKYEYNGKCYENCFHGFLYAENNNKTNECKCELEKCLTCPNVALKKGLCTKCNYNYYQKEHDPLNLGEYINCYKEPEGYYLDNNIYKHCYYRCKTCKTSGNDSIHNCIECNDNYLYKMKLNNYNNCYENCSNYYYVVDEINYYCTQDLNCPKEYPKLIKDKMECTKYNIEIIKDEILIRNDTQKLLKSEEIEYYDNLIKIIETDFTESYDTSKLDNGHDEVIETGKITVTLTTLQNQKNNINSNMTTIDLGKCENLLRIEYNISLNETLYIKKLDVKQEGIKSTKVEYDVYCKLFGTNLIKLNLTVCSNSKISIYTPIIITENIDKYNSSSGYYLSLHNQFNYKNNPLALFNL